MIFYSFIDRNEIRHNDEYELNLENVRSYCKKFVSLFPSS